MWRNIASNALTLFVVILVVVGGVVAWAKNQYSAPGPLETAICLNVERGSNMGAVSDTLASENAITSPYIFKTGANYAEKSQLLKAGRFLVPSGASMEQIVDIVTRGGASTCGTKVIYRIGITSVVAEVLELDPETNRFVELAEFAPAEDTVPEAYARVREQADTGYEIQVVPGATVWQVVEGLKSADFLAGEVTEYPTEGSLAPDSYEVSVDQSRGELLDLMEQKQSIRLEEAWANRAEGLPLKSKEEALILASIVEKETAVADERRQVASVFENRLKRGMRLQTDPTVIYGVTKGQGVLGRGLRQSELRRETPYNTYVIEGLPPTPIANPGLESIQAAVNPDTTPYIFFVADGTGGHAFAETLDEHNKNVAAWRKIEASRN